MKQSSPQIPADGGAARGVWGEGDGGSVAAEIGGVAEDPAEAVGGLAGELAHGVRVDELQALAAVLRLPRDAGAVGAEIVGFALVDVQRRADGGGDERFVQPAVATLLPLAMLLVMAAARSARVSGRLLFSVFMMILLCKKERSKRFCKPHAHAGAGIRLPRGAGVAGFRHGVGDFLTDFAQSEAGAGAGVVDPESAPVFSRLAGRDPDGGQYAEAGNGGS